MRNCCWPGWQSFAAVVRWKPLRAFAVRAKAAYQQVIASGHASSAHPAACVLGVLLERQGDLDGAKAALQRAIASGDARWAPHAPAILWHVLKDHGDLDGAKAVYQRAIASGYRDVSKRIISVRFQQL
jgi:predicted negative regulator of RcsB-dependent stress response